VDVDAVYRKLIQPNVKIVNDQIGFDHTTDKSHDSCYARIQ
jgi:hypothetical protein